MRIAAFTRYGRRAASTRQRFLQYVPALRAAGIEVAHHALLDDDYVASLASGEPYPKARIARAYARRIGQLAAARSADLFWIYAELLPFVPAPIERLATVGKPVVYDFDDAFFHSYDQSSSSAVRALLAGKHCSLLRHAAACTCGNAYLRDYAARSCSRSIVVPTVVDTDSYRPAEKAPGGAPTIGWIGSPSTWRGVQPILPVLADLCARHQARFLVIGAGPEAARAAFPQMQVKAWSEATEIADVQSMDIGIMPLLDRPFERGKSGYKLIQYMGCGLPVVASPIGVNRQIVKDGINGYLAATEQQWREALSALLIDPQLRARFGAAGREQAVESYSLRSQQGRLIELFKSLG